MTRIVEITEFLRARLDEDEEIAWRCIEGGAGRYARWIFDRETHSVVAPHGSVIASRSQPDTLLSDVDGEHIARHDPARVQGEVRAKRRLIQDALAQRHHVDPDAWYTCAAATLEHDGGEMICDTRERGVCDCGRDVTVEHRLRLLAMPYSSHPDYRTLWRP